MDLILKIFGVIGILVVLMIVAVLVLWWVIKSKIRGFFKGLEELKYAAPVPARLRLVRDDHLAWQRGPEVAKLTEQLHDLGFQDAGSYSTEEIEFLRMRAFANPDEAVYAVVYEHDQAGVWMDYVVRYQDGTSLTCTSTGQDQTDERPGHRKVPVPGADAALLYQRLREERSELPRKPAPVEEFVSVFEQAYAEAMDWRNARGGPTEEEIRRIAAASGQEVTDEMVEMIRESKRREDAEGLNEALLERFVQQTTMSAAEWEKVRERVVIIHDQMPLEMVTEAYEEWACESGDEDEELDDEPETPEIPDGMAPRAAFRYLNEQLPPDRRFTLLGELSEPVRADVYGAPGGARVES